MTVVPDRKTSASLRRRKWSDAAKAVLTCMAAVTASAGATKAVAELIRFLLGG